MVRAVSATPLQQSAPADNTADTLRPLDHEALGAVLPQLYAVSRAELFGISAETFEEWMLAIGESEHWGKTGEAPVTAHERITFLERLKVSDLVLARACAAGNELAWETFLVRYRETLYGAAYSITKQDAAGRELADSLYADLYGTTERDGVRRSRLDSYLGRGSLAGWLRSVLAQRFVDGYRKTRREVSLDDGAGETRLAAQNQVDSAVDSSELATVAAAVSAVLARMGADERFLLASYYLDGRTLQAIAMVLGVHESTVSRKLDRLTTGLRKELIREMQEKGLNRTTEEEALKMDVRDLDISVRKLLQVGAHPSFQKKGGETDA